MKYFNEKEIIVSNEIEWLPFIPKTWKLCRLKDFALIETGIKNTEDKIAEGIYPFFVRSQTIEYSDTFSFEGEAILTAGDGVGVGKVFHHYNGKFETHQRVYRICKFKNLNGRFLFYYISENLSKETLKYNSKATVDSLRMPTFQRFPLLLPPLSEQTVISQYLDTKTQAIDKKINLLTKKTETYKELRKSIINNAVCKGLDKNVKLKESGIYYINSIPIHWKVERIKDQFYIGRGRVIGQEALIENGKYPVFSSQTENNGCLGYIETFDFYKDLLTWTTDGANAGTVFRRSGKFNCTNVCGTLIPKKKNLDLNYVVYALQESATHNKRIDTNGAKIMNNEMAVIHIAFPPKQEQTAIANYLDEKTQKIDAIISNIGKQIDTLKELRKTLINDVVTGKIKVTEV